MADRYEVHVRISVLVTDATALCAAWATVDSTDGDITSLITHSSEHDLARDAHRMLAMGRAKLGERGYEILGITAAATRSEGAQDPAGIEEP
ncbi:hypothetical protein OVA14_01960 [Agrococcus sp. SL85]|uniref:hypothetical protein n=1 Tax=Agrococcus sp. SL85 TaxID=2995141 RepID=UPI00226D2CAE|nr:hypothetical protein [Agrococcus sp. SL85]WAC66573.1 hypothetical protein OVA14_01960 [Agrococcus sp. SL85]